MEIQRECKEGDCKECPGCPDLVKTQTENGARLFKASVYDLTYDECPVCGDIYYNLKPKPKNQYEDYYENRRKTHGT